MKNKNDRYYLVSSTYKVTQMANPTLIYPTPIHHPIHYHESIISHLNPDDLTPKNPNWVYTHCFPAPNKIYIPHHPHTGPQHTPQHQGSNPDKSDKDVAITAKEIREQFFAPQHGHHTHTFPCTDGHGHVITKTIECDRENCSGLVFMANPTTIPTPLPTNNTSTTWSFA